MSTWQKYGEWQYDLLNGRDQLTEPFKSKLRELTANCGTDREKVKAVYDYLAKTTRYVSIQLGIGAIMPVAIKATLLPFFKTTPLPISNL